MLILQEGITAENNMKCKWLEIRKAKRGEEGEGKANLIWWTKQEIVREGVKLPRIDYDNSL